MFSLKFPTRFAAFILLFALCIAYSSGAMAQNDIVEVPSAQAQPPVDILPAKQAEERGIAYDNDMITHPPLKLTPDKSELIRLDKAAGSIIIGNPNHLSILADNAKTLIAIPRMVGATFFTVLGKDGNVIMQRHVIVASPKEKYLRVRRSCAGAESDCQPTQMYYCPDMCHEIIMGDGEGGGQTDGSSGGAGAPGAEGPPTQTDTSAAGGEDTALLP